MERREGADRSRGRSVGREIETGRKRERERERKREMQRGRKTTSDEFDPRTVVFPLLEAAI